MPSRLSAVVRAMRPHHWVKNGFVFAPAIFSGHLTDWPALLRVAAVAAAFCLIASAGYLINDILDRDSDRLDPVKRRRPIASGELAIRDALVVAAGAAVAGLALAACGGVWGWRMALAYGAITLLYSLYLKTVAIVEAITIAAGFLVRLAAGALAIPVMMSHWLVICGFLLALLLAFGKRTGDTPGRAGRTPAYPATFLQVVVPLLAGVTLVSYVLYTVAPETVSHVGSNRLLLTAPLVLFGILRYLLLLHRSGAQDPTMVLIADRPLLATVLLWTATAAAVLTRVPFGG